MPIFDVGSAAYQTASPGTTTAAQVWSGTVTALVGTGPTYSHGTLGPTVRDLTVINTGTCVISVGQSGVTATTGVLLVPGAQMTIQNWQAQVGTTTSDVYAIAYGPSSVTIAGVTYTGGASTTVAGLATLASVV